MSTGLERSVAIREHEVNESRAAIDQIDNQLLLIDERISFKEILDENQLKKDSYEGVAVQIGAIDEQINQLKQQISDLRNPSATDEINELKAQSEYLKKENNELANAIAQTNKAFDQKLENSYLMNRTKLHLLFGVKKMCVKSL